MLEMKFQTLFIYLSEGPCVTATHCCKAGQHKTKAKKQLVCFYQHMTWRAYEADTLPFHCPCCRAITDRQVWRPIRLLISFISPA